MNMNLRKEHASETCDVYLLHINARVIFIFFSPHFSTYRGQTVSDFEKQINDKMMIYICDNLNKTWNEYIHAYLLKWVNNLNVKMKFELVLCFNRMQTYASRASFNCVSSSAATVTELLNRQWPLIGCLESCVSPAHWLWLAIHEVLLH